MRSEDSEIFVELDRALDAVVLVLKRTGTLEFTAIIDGYQIRISRDGEMPSNSMN